MRNFFIHLIMIFSALTFATTTNVNAQIYGKWVLPCTIYGSDDHSPYLLTFDQTGLQFTQLNGQYNNNLAYCEFSSGGYDVFKNVQFYTLGTEIHYGNSNDHINYITTPYPSLVPEYQVIPKPGNTDKYFTFVTGINIGFLRNLDFHFDYNEITMVNGVPQNSNLITIRGGIDNTGYTSFAITDEVNNQRYLFASTLRNATISGDDKAGLRRWTITSAGVSNENVIIDEDNPNLNQYDFDAYNLEWKKDENGYNVIAWINGSFNPLHNQTVDRVIVVRETSSNHYEPSIYDLNLGRVGGIEFSYVDGASNEELFVSCQNGGIRKLNYITGALSPMLPNSDNYGHTFLQYAPDGNIYGVKDDGTKLGRINGITGNFEPDVITAPLSYGIFSTFRTFNDTNYYILPENGTPYHMIDSAQITQLDCSNDTSGQIVIYPLGGCCTDQCTIYCTFSDGTVIPFDWDAVNHYFFNVVDLWQGTYTYTITCGPSSVTNTFTIGIDYSHYLDENGMFTISTDLTIPSNNFPFYNYKFMNGIRVTNNAVLTVNGELFQFDENAKVIIEPGAKLVINNSVLTSHCNNVWQGIEVWGNSAKSQYPGQNGIYSQGYLKLDNNSVIENAVCAVDMWNPGYWSTTGGIVHSNNTNFINCTKSVHALYYKNYNPNDPNQNELPYNAIFKLDTFEITSSYSGNNRFYKHVDLSHVKGINFKGCYFSRDVSATNVSDYDLGIAAYNAGFNVKDVCTSQVAPCPDNDLIPCTFNGFYSALLADGDKSNSYVFNVYNADFINNMYGVKSTHFKNFTIINSNFEVGHNNSPETMECINASGYGIWTDFCNGFAIEENNFSKYGGAPTAYYTGISIGNTNATDEVYKNYFDGLSYADFSQGKNWDHDNRFKGLAYYCNQNTGNYADFYVEKNEQGIGGIQSQQGNLDHAAGNTFSPNSTYDFYNGGEHLVGYYYNENGINETPDINKVYHVVPYAVSDVNQCESHYGGNIRGNTVLSSQQRQTAEQIFSDNLADYNSVKTLYDNLKDGGSTSNELSDIENAQPSDMWTLRTHLLGDSPHLSMEVLKKTADRTDVFPDATIFDILAANPDELKNDDLIKYLEEKDNPLPQYMIDILKQLANGSTYKTVLQTQMAYYNQLKTRAANDIIRSILNDSIVDYNDLRNWLDNLGGISADRQIIGSYITQGNFSDAMNLANMLPQLYDLQGTDSIEHLFYMDMLTLYDTLSVQGRNTEQLDSTELTQLAYIADSSKDVAGAQARSILESVYGYHFTNCPQCNDSTAGYKNSPYVRANRIADVYGISVTANPNPASQWTAINYILRNEQSKAVIEITDLTGRIIAGFNVSGKQDQKVWDTRNIPSGVYLINLKTEGFVKTAKLVISN